MNSHTNSHAFSPLCPPSHLWRCRATALAAVLISFSPSCTSKKPDRPDKAYFKEPGSWVVSRRIDEPDCGRDERTKFVVTEFYENGTPKVPEQLTDAVKVIESFHPKTVLLYVHGWNNDSSPCYGEAKGKDMNDLDGLVHAIVEADAGKTVAIYVGWRGVLKNSFLAGVPDLDTRRQVARDIGGYKPFQAFLGKVAMAGKAQGANVVFVGHSLGAALMEKAASGMIGGRKKGEDAHLPHLFILANSAERAEVSQEFIDKINKSELVQSQQQGTKLSSPRVLAVTSVKDSADKRMNPLFNFLFLGEAFSKTIGFDERKQTHVVQNTYIPKAVVPSTAVKTQFEESLKPTLDPAFWVPNKSGDKLSKYRIVPKSDSVRTPGFWNIQIPGELCIDHNDVYNPKIMAASIAWLRLAHHSGKDLPDDLPEILSKLFEELKTHPPGPEYSKGRDARTQWVMGAALRMPYNPTSFDVLLKALERSEDAIIDKLDISPAKSPSQPEIIEKYRINLFSILKYTHSADGVWSSEPTLLARLRALMEKAPLRSALAQTGNAEGVNDRETDKNLKAFYKFLRKHDIRTP